MTSVSVHSSMFQEPAYKEGPFPEGWEQFIDGSTNKVVYIDHINKRTTWIDPRDNYTRVRARDELPFGWTEEYDRKKDMPYFMDNIKRIATRVDPRTGQEVPMNGMNKAKERFLEQFLTADALLQRGGRSEYTDPSNASQTSESFSVGSYVRDAYSTGYSQSEHSTGVSSGRSPTSPALEGDVEQSEVVRQLYDEHEDEVMKDREEAVAQFARSCGITPDMLRDDPALRPVKVARARKLERMVLDMSSYNNVMDDAIKDLRVSLRAAKTGAPRNTGPKSCPDLDAAQYLTELQQIVDDRRNDISDLQNLMGVLTTAVKQQTPPPQIAERIERQFPAAAALLLELLLEGGGGRAAPDQKAMLFEKLQTALAKRVEYYGIMNCVTPSQPMYDAATSRGHGSGAVVNPMYGTVGGDADPVVTTTPMNAGTASYADLLGHLSM